MFDAHCHLDLVPAPLAAWRSAQEGGLRGALVAGVDPEGWDRQLALVGEGLHHAIGLHPWATDLSPTALRQALDRLQELHPRCQAIGETGLDLRRGQPPEARQLRALRAQLALAREWELPVVLHAVRAHAALLRVIDQDGLPRAGAVVHGFTGSAELAREWSRRGCWLSVGGAATWPLSPSRAAGLRAIPDARLLVETDAPDQPPEPWRSQRVPGSPAMLAAVIEAVAEARGSTRRAVATLTEQNARRMLGRGGPG